MIKNNIKHYVLIFLCTFSVTTIAAMQERDNGPLDRLDGYTYYETLESYFNSSAAAERSNVLGWTSGRCYSLEDQNSPKATMLVGFQLGPKPTHHKFAILNSVTESPKYYDTFDSNNGDSVGSSLARFSSLEDGSLVYRNSFAFSTDTKYSLRKNVMPGSGMPYLLSKTTLLTYPGGVINNAFTHYCYYFKKIR